MKLLVGILLLTSLHLLTAADEAGKDAVTSNSESHSEASASSTKLFAHHPASPASPESANTQSKPADSQPGIDKMSKDWISAGTLRYKSSKLPLPRKKQLATQMISKEAASARPSAADPDQYRVSVCVPCIPRDIQYLPRMVKSIKAQSFQPLEVVISISNSSEAEGTKVQNELAEIFPSVRVVTFPQLLSPMQSRSEAVKASSGNIISFMDADDEMHFQKLEIVTSVMKEEKSACVLHSLVLRPKLVDNMVFDWHKTYIMRGEAIYKSTVEQDGGQPSSTISIAPKGLHVGDMRVVTQGHPTVIRDVATRIVPTSLERGEDCYFLRSLLSELGPHDTSMTYVDLPLTFYHPSEHPDNNWLRALPKGLIQIALGPEQPQEKAKIEESRFSPESVIGRIAA